jgi:hypothetical protein
MPTEPTGRKRGRPRDPLTPQYRRKTLHLTEAACTQLEAQAEAAGLSVAQYVTRLVQEAAEKGGEAQ